MATDLQLALERLRWPDFLACRSIVSETVGPVEADTADLKAGLSWRCRLAAMATTKQSALGGSGSGLTRPDALFQTVKYTSNSCNTCSLARG